LELEAQILERVVSRAQRCERTKARLKDEWRQSVAIYTGKQWAIIRDAISIMHSRTDVTASRAVLNIYQAYANGAVSMLTTGTIQPEVIPENDEPETLERVNALNALMNYIWMTREANIRNAAEEAVLWMVLTGNAFLVSMWDEALGEEYYLDPETGAQRKYGLPKIVAFSPFHGGYDTLVPLEESRWAYLLSVIPKDELVARYGDAAKDLQPDATMGDVPFRDESESAQSERNGILLYHYWEIPCEEYPQGLLVHATKTKLLSIEEWPSTKLPVVHLKLYTRPGSQWGMTPFIQAIPVQVELNRLLSDILDNASRINAPAVMAPKGTMQRPPSYAPAARNEYDAKAGLPPPVITQIPAMPQWAINFVDNLVKQFELIVGLQGVIFGNAPFSRVSGRTYSLMLEQVSRQYYAPAERLANALCVVGDQLIELWLKYGPKELATTIAPDEPTILVRSDAVSGPRRLHLSPTEVLAISKQAKINELKELVQLQIITKERFLQLAADLGAEYRRADESLGDRTWVRRQIRNVTAGLPVEPTIDIIDPKIAMKELGDYLKSNRAGTLDQLVLQNLVALYNDLKARAEAQDAQAQQQQAGQEAGQMQQPIAGGVPDTQGLPPELSAGVPPRLGGVDFAENLNLGVPQ